MALPDLHGTEICRPRTNKAPVISPLRKRTLEGKLYTRDAKIRAKLSELEALSRDKLVERLKIRRRDDPGYVPSECLLYFVRATRMDNSAAHFERLYKALIERVLRSLPRPESADGKTVSLTKSRIREKVADRFVSLLAGDRTEYAEALDYFELRFDGGLANLRRDAQEQVWRETNRTTSLEFNEETGEPSPEIERAAGSFDPFKSADFGAEDYRSHLHAAIATLPVEQTRIVEMLRQGIPIDSKDPNVVTIAKTLGKSEKTIRLHRDKAFAALRAALKRGEDT
jgi:hypothetical protein